MKSSDVIIIGAGIAGLSTAYELLQRAPGLSVTLLEAGPYAGHGASWANGSMVHPSQATPWAESLCDDSACVARSSFVMAARSAKIIARNMDDFGIEARHRKSGCAKLYQTRAAMDADMDKLLNLADAGLRAQVLTPAQMRALFPLMGAKIPVAGGVFFPDDYSGPPRLYCAALLERIIDMGAHIQVNAKVSAIETGRVVLSTGEGLNSDLLILCAGAGSLGFKDYLDITPVRGYSRTFDLPAKYLPDMAIMDDTAHMSVTPLGDHLRVSGGADIEADDCIYEKLEAYALALLPGLAERLRAAPQSDWTAQRPMSVCGPVIGRIAPGIFANTGHGHMGWTLCAGAAKACIDAVLAA